LKRNPNLPQKRKSLNPLTTPILESRRKIWSWKNLASLDTSLFMKLTKLCQPPARSDKMAELFKNIFLRKLIVRY